MLPTTRPFVKANNINLTIRISDSKTLIAAVDMVNFRKPIDFGSNLSTPVNYGYQHLRCWNPGSHTFLVDSKSDIYEYVAMQVDIYFHTRRS